MFVQAARSGNQLHKFRAAELTAEMAGDMQGKKCPKRNISAGCIPEITCQFSKHIPSEHIRWYAMYLSLVVVVLVSPLLTLNTVKNTLFSSGKVQILLLLFNYVLSKVFSELHMFMALTVVHCDKFSNFKSILNLHSFSCVHLACNIMTF